MAEEQDLYGHRLNAPEASHRKRLGPITVDRELVSSPAFLALRGHAPQVLLIFFTKRQMAQLHNGKKKGPWTIVNNGHIVFTYREAKSKYGLNETTFKRALNELSDKGFVRLTPVDEKDAARWDLPAMYELTDDWKHYVPQPPPTQQRHAFTKGHQTY